MLNFCKIGNTPFLEACSEGNIEVMKILLESGCAIDDVNYVRFLKKRFLIQFFKAWRRSFGNAFAVGRYSSV